VASLRWRLYTELGCRIVTKASAMRVMSEAPVLCAYIF
jgi:hypothetical protein